MATLSEKHISHNNSLVLKRKELSSHLSPRILHGWEFQYLDWFYVLASHGASFHVGAPNVDRLLVVQKHKDTMSLLNYFFSLEPIRTRPNYKLYTSTQKSCIHRNRRLKKKHYNVFASSFLWLRSALALHILERRSHGAWYHAPRARFTRHGAQRGANDYAPCEASIRHSCSRTWG